MNILKLSKNVGRNCYPDQSDVAVVQTCLANIKAKTKFGMKPIWQGRIDGKNSKDLVCAIEHFQSHEGLKVTGKIEALGGQTFSRLRQRTPTPILDRLLKEPFMGNLPNEHIFKVKQEELKRLIQAIRSLPHNSVGPQLEKYWKTLKVLSDPIASVALDIHFNRGLAPVSSVPLMKSYLGDKFIRENPPRANELEYRAEFNRGQGGHIPVESYRKRQHEWVDDMFRRIQVAIAVHHWNTAAKDIKGTLGKLNKDQITGYHHTVFKAFGLPKNAFGGTIFQGTPLSFLDNISYPLWCMECDEF